MEKSTKIIIIVLLVVAAIVGVIYASKGYSKTDSFIDEEYTDSSDGLTPEQRAANDKAHIEIVKSIKDNEKRVNEVQKNLTLGILTGGIYNIPSLFKKKKKS